MSSLPRPDVAEYNEYYKQYIDLVPDGDIVSTLRYQQGDTLALLASAREGEEIYRYAEDKWSLREVLGHLIDTERVFSFRALTIARQDGAELPGMDQEEWATRSDAHDRPMRKLTREWSDIRKANVHMFEAFDADIGGRTGIASGFEFSVRSFPWIIAGHELWHRDLIKRHYLGNSG